MVKADHDKVIEELPDDDFDSLRDLMEKVFRSCNGLEHAGRAVPTYNFVQAAEKAGYTSLQMRSVLSRTPGQFAVRFPSLGAETTIHCWYRGDKDRPPSERAPRVPRTVRIARVKKQVFPDKRYRIDKKIWRGIDILKAYEAGDL